MVFRSCAAADKISTDLRARAVSLRQLSYLFIHPLTTGDLSDCEPDINSVTSTRGVCMYIDVSHIMRQLNGDNFLSIFCRLSNCRSAAAVTRFENAILTDVAGYFYHLYDCIVFCFFTTPAEHVRTRIVGQCPTSWLPCRIQVAPSVQRRSLAVQ